VVEQYPDVETVRSRIAFQRLDSSSITKPGTNDWVRQLDGQAIVKGLGPFVNNSEVYRANAVASAKLAEAVNDPYDKVVLLNMAEAWLRLADYVERKQKEAVEHFGVDRSTDQDVNPV
jgi:hypothetical protein